MRAKADMPFNPANGGSNDRFWPFAYRSAAVGPTALAAALCEGGASQVLGRGARELSRSPGIPIGSLALAREQGLDDPNALL